MLIHHRYSDMQNRGLRFSLPFVVLTLPLMWLCFESVMSACGGDQHAAPAPGLVG